MLSLRNLQESFAAAIYEDDGAVTASVRAGAFGAERRLQIYRRNTFATLTDALAADYPVVRRLVGDAFFDYAADGYIRRHPPRSGNLHDFGAAFAEFLASFAPAQSLPYLPHVALLERARVDAYHAADVSSTVLDQLAAVPPEKYSAIIFKLHPAVKLVTSTYPILRIWSANQPDAADQTVNLDDGGERVLVARPGIDITMTAITPAEFELLHAVAESRPLVVANDAALSVEPGFDLMRALQKHVATCTIVGFRFE